MLENLKNRLLSRFMDRALPVSTVTDERLKRFSYLKAVGTKELERILDDEFSKLMEDPETKQIQFVENKTMAVETPLGILKASAATDPNHPGIYIDLVLPGTTAEVSLALVEFCDVSDMDTDVLGTKQIITRIWGDDEKEDYTDRIIHHLHNKEL